MTDRQPVAVVTGASRGIGRAIAAHLGAQGYAVIGTSRSAPRAEDATADFAMLRCDVTDTAQVAELFDTVRRRHGRLHVLVNNAAIAGGAPFGSDAEAAEWGPMLATNLTGTWACCRAARELLVDGAGRIVNISSILGLRGVADQLAYSASKHGVIGLSRSLARALGPRGITVNAVCPGWVATEMALGRLEDLGLSPEQAVALTPTRRFSEPAEVAALVGFLASAAAANITGQALSIDGGALA
ncbi:MAG TPA: SDR family NAD(P)-dependent oxidoreductase [Pseudorhodoferax sp.]|jgi:NAD(P)-dependent dehydrogenase (short-subunit alcohol dehydrogenase family)|nr:SDR family NAD(P)-dependent oxidoreductase [Pseudorhodoferax sp.]